jgi:hypothetical protein
MSSRIQLRRSSAADWSTINPVLSQGEIGLELDTGRLKIGDGLTPWNGQPYFTTTTTVGQLVNDSGYITSSAIPTEISAFNNDVGYLLSTEFTSTPAFSITSNNISNWNTAYGWGNHNIAGYLLASVAATTYQPVDADLTAIAASTGTGFLKRTAINTWSLDNTNYQPLDADLTAIAALTGNRGLLRKTAADVWTLDTTEYLTTADAAGGLNSELIDNWNEAYSWGDHSVAGYLLSSTAASTYQPLDADLTAIAALTGTSGLLRKSAADTWSLDTTSYLTTTDADTTYLTQASASSTYLTQTNAATTYLTQTNAATTYLTQTNAATTYLTQTSAASTYQPLDADLTAIAELTTTGFLRRTGPNTWSLDNNTYLNSGEIAAAYQPKNSSVIPASPTSTGTAGDMAYGPDYLYVCIATNTWRRIEWSNWAGG